MRHRRGFTLVELLVVMTTSTLILGLCVGLIHSLLRIDRVVRANLTEHAMMGRLSHMFRRDVRAAEKVDAAAGALGPDGRLVLSLRGNRRFEYEFQAGKLIRELPAGDEVQSQETFRLPRFGVGRFEVKQQEHPIVVSLVFETQPQSKDKALGRALRIESILGRDHRFERNGD